MNIRTQLIHFILILISSPLAMASEKLQVVASFSVLGDLSEQLAGDKIELTTLVGANADSHGYKPTPHDAKTLAKADILIVNGLSFEGWMERLEEASGFKGKLVVASHGADIIDIHREEHADQEHQAHDKHQKKGHDEHEEHDEHHKKEHDEHQKHDDHNQDAHTEQEAHDDHHHHGDKDPHAWHSLANIKVYADNISAALIAKDPDNQTYYQQKKAAFIERVNALQKELSYKVSQLPTQSRKVMTSHDAFGYIARDYGFEFFAPIGLSTQAEPSAADVAELIRQVKQQNIKALFIENVSDDRLIKQIGRQNQVKVGGKLYSDALSAKNEPADTYLKMMKHNLETLINALQ